MAPTAEVVQFPGGGDNADAPFEIGSWSVEPKANLVYHRGEEIRLEPRVMRTLVVLAAHAPEPVPREQLMQAVWGHQHITDNALDRAISRLRKVLSNDGDGVLIETLPRVGYRLVPPGDSGIARRRRRGLVSRWFAIEIGVVVGVLIAAGLATVYFRQEAATELRMPTRVVPLTSLPGMEVEPDLSPDGSHVVFAWKGPTQDDWDLFVRPVDSEALLRLTQHPARDRAPAWSPDGSRIAFIRSDERSCIILAISPIGGPERRLADCDPEADEVLAWTPDGRGLVFVPPQDNEAKGLSLLDLDASRFTVLTAPDAGELGDAQAVVSPAGDQIAFVRWHTYGVGNVFVVPAEGGPARQVTFDNLKIHGVSWEPDSRHVVFGSNRSGGAGLWRVDTAGGAPQRIPVMGRAADNPVVSASGNRIVYEEWNDRMSLYAADPDTETDPVALIASTRWDRNPAVSPDGNLITFVSDRSGTMELWLADLDGDNTVLLTGFGGPYVSGPSFSPNGRYIAFDAPVDGDFDLWIVDISGGAPLQLTRDAAQDRVASWSIDGRSIYFSSTREDGWQLWRYGLNDRVLTRITRNGGYLARESADGFLYYSRCDRTGGLWRTPIGGGEETLVTARLQPYHCADWLLDDGGILFVHRETDETQWLRRHGIDEGVDRAVRELPGFLSKSGLARAPDGRIIYGRLEHSESDLMLVDR